MSNKDFTTWEELEMSSYQMFRMTEAEHVENNYPTHWTEESANPEYEKFIHEQYMGTF